MPDWTPKQDKAIKEEGHNILVSAGAGSGKTAVLSERVLRKLTDGSGVNIDEILILTFTNKAAYEMMIRIRDNLKKAGLTEQLKLIDKAYITTFDSFTSSIVKKYHDRLNIDKNFSIVDENTIDLVRSRTLDEIFDKYYESNDKLFHKLINDYCLKDDKTLKNNILNINKALDLKYNKLEYLDEYFDNYFNDNYYDYLISEYEKYIKEKIISIIDMAKTVDSMVDNPKFNGTMLNIIDTLENSNTYEDIRNNININLPSLPKNSGDEVSGIKDKLKKELDKIKKLTKYGKDELIEDYKSTKDYIEIIIKIIIELDNKVNDYKFKHNAFEFVDIEKLAISLVKKEKYKDIKEELTKSFKEVMVDEYQDTSDLQEELISNITNNNTYMVGDIKQSIYRFRNANPNIFKEKYESFVDESDDENIGIKIDLTKNFRSRDEVIKDINTVFDDVMSISFGGADYQKSHRLLFGLETYLEKKKEKQQYNLTIKDYTLDKESNYNDYNEVEAFIVAKDIKEKIDSKFQVYDKEEKIIRDIKYSDFVILINKGEAFTLYKHIFEYLNIPLTLEKDVDISKEIEVSLIKNILKMIKAISIGDGVKDKEFKYGYTSIARSYLFRLSDQEIYEIINKEKYEDTIIYKKISNIVSNLETLDLKTLIIRIINEFDFYEKMITIGDIDLRTTILDKIINLANDLMILDYDYLVFIDYLDDILNDKDKKINVSVAVSDNNSVKIMTIHKSKGLEYPICYYTGLKNGFNFTEVNANILFNNKYGIVPSSFNHGYHSTFVKNMTRNDFINEEISERIRLFYVALTRAREKMIMVADLSEDDKDGILTDRDRSNYKSFLDIMNSVKHKLTKYIEKVDLSKVGLTKDYLDMGMVKKLETSKEKPIEVNELNIITEEENEEHFSKVSNKLVTKEQKENMLFGTKVHELFELIDFKNPRLDEIDIDNNLKKYISNLLNQELLKNIKDAKILKEYEFLYEEDNSIKRGSIDLMIEYNDYIDIIDYKLKNIDDEAYLNQLNGYKKYIESKTNKQVNIYLYSILKNTMTKIG